MSLLSVSQPTESLLSKKKKTQPKPTSAGKPAKKKKGKAAPTGKTIAENRKARHNYELLEKLECGIHFVNGKAVPALSRA